jgi:hypothetical protein
MEDQTKEQKLLTEFSDQLQKIASNIIGRTSNEYLPWVETDSLYNQKLRIIEELRGWRGIDILGEHEAREIRARILEEHREEIIAELNQDSLKTIEDLKRTIKIMKEREEFQRRYGA